MTGAPDPNEVGEMARLIRMMNAGVSFDDSEIVTESVDTDSPIAHSIGEPVIRLGSVDPSVGAMKKILEAFNSPGPVGELNDRAERDRELREALVTEQTETGTRIGSWEISINEDARGLKTFDVTNIRTGEPIATELSLYDAAHGICRALNEGHMINSSRVRDILTAEFDYLRARQNAAEFHEKVRTYESAHPRRALMEDRFDEALQRAKSARSRVMKLSKL